jgi:hypothetical protein
MEDMSAASYARIMIFNIYRSFLLKTLLLYIFKSTALQHVSGGNPLDRQVHAHLPVRWQQRLNAFISVPMTGGAC